VIGDIGLAVFASRDISLVKRSHALANPGSRRKFDLSDGIVIVGWGNAPPSNFVQFLAGGGILVEDQFGNSISMASSGTTLTDSNGNSVTMGAGGITLSTPTGSVQVL
jgi:hypothetical protein